MPTRLHKLMPLGKSQSADIFGLQPAVCSLQPEGILASSTCQSPATEEQPYVEENSPRFGLGARAT